jgi:chloramphenicol-sensitive protein RarD
VQSQAANPARNGVLAIVGACAIWGFAPLFYHHLREVPALEIMAHRTIWTGVMFALWVTLQGRWPLLVALLRGPDRGRVVAAGLLIGFNWGLFIWAVTSGRALEASLGYYILPLVSAVLGFVLLKERLRPVQVAAIGLATLAVLVLTWGLRVAPVIALALATSFSVYSLVKRPIRAPALIVVLAEVLVIGLPMLALLIWAAWHGGDWGWFGRDTYHSGLLIVMGPISGLPLALFSWGAQRVKLATSGLVAYLNPTLQLLSAVLLMGEPMTHWHAVALAMIWVAIALYTGGALAADRRARSAVSSAGTSGKAV